MKQYHRIILTFATLTAFISAGMLWMIPGIVSGQSKTNRALPQAVTRDPFLFPPGVYPLSEGDTPGGTLKPVRHSEEGLRAILIGNHIRLALIDRHIVTLGDFINNEKIVEIKPDRVLLSKGGQTRSLYLSQNPVVLTVEEIKGDER